MADNQENILVEFDYNNIIIIDPNKVIDEKGRAKERYVKQEDLVMYANLECKVLPRTKLALGVANNDSIQTVSVANINFLNPGNKGYLDNSYTDELTGKGSVDGKGVNQPNLKSVSNPQKSDDYYIRQTINSNGKPGATDNGLLGITSITVKQNTSFMSTVTIELIDIKGRALFESGDNSPYAPFFNLPYPMFHLTLKGYYGKAVKLSLMLQTFNATYDGSTGNFKVTLEFYTYKYTLLSEVSMGALIATPHMYKTLLNVNTNSGTDSKFQKTTDVTVEKGTQKIKEMYSEYKTKGLIPDDFPEITLIQMRDRIELFIKRIMDSFVKQDLDPLTDLEKYQKTLNEYEKRVYYGGLGGLDKSWFETNINSKDYFILKDSGIKIYTFNTGVNTTDAISKLKSIIAEYNKLLSENKTVGKNGKYTINGVTKNSRIPNNISYQTFEMLDITPEDVDFNETYVRLYGKQPTDLQVEELRIKFEKLKIFNAGEIKKGNPNVIPETKTEPIYYWFKFESGNQKSSKIKVINQISSVLGGKDTFIDSTNEINKKLKGFREDIELELTKALSKELLNKDTGIGFVPSIRNVLAVIFANGEAFLRLMDDVHTQAWDKRDEKIRKSVIFDKQIAGASQDTLTDGDDSTSPVYPWPQLIVETSGEDGHEKYEITYPGDPKVISRTKGFLYDVWPEVEFVEEFIKGSIQRAPTPKDDTGNFNEVNDPFRVSLDAIEFPVGNYVFSNKEEIKYFYELYERIFLISNYSKLSRSNDFISDADLITNLISDAESINIIQSLGNDNPFIIKKLKEYNINSTNILPILRHFSNEGLGESWQKLIRGIFNTGYIKNIVNNGGFEYITSDILNSSISQPLKSLPNEDGMSKYISESTTSNKYDFTDTYPFTNQKWIKENLSNGNTILNANSAFNTGKILSFNQNYKVITNFLDVTSPDQKRPISNFVYKDITIPTSQSLQNLKLFYNNRNGSSQLPTEGRVEYLNYLGNIVSVQTTSIFNTPYFINSIQEGVQNYRNSNQYPYISSAYYFLNSLPLSTLRENYKTYEKTNNIGSVKELDYVFATLKKYGAIHKLPYAWVLKFGSIWHRYKTYIETGNDIINTSWSGFSYINNFDPVTNSPTRDYNLVINGANMDIILEQDVTIGSEQSTLINTGFYPKLINDFNVFYQGFQIYSGYSNTDIQLGFNSGVTLNYVSDAIIDSNSGTTTTRNIRIIPWSVTVDTFDNLSTFVMPSQGSLINQTKQECFDSNGNKIEVLGNKSMYDGSVRLFWAAPNYGYFDDSRVIKPSPTEYMKKIYSGTVEQENFSINGNSNGYSKISEIFSVFEKSILDGFETEFLNFSKSEYDYTDSNITTNNTETTKSYKNFQMLMRQLMKIPKEFGNTGDEIVSKIQVAQTNNLQTILTGFLNYDIVFKYGNPSNFDKRLFYSFASSPFTITDPYTWEKYTVLTPNSLPSSSGGITLSQSKLNYPDAWKALETYVGFSEIPELTYDNNGSYITDFFIDMNVAFTEDNVKNLVTIIKLYATQKLEDNTMNSTKFSNLLSDYLTNIDDFQNKIINNLSIKLQRGLPDVSSVPENRIESDLNGIQTKVELWETFKALNDKWISGNDFKTKTLFEDVLLFDRASRDIGDKVMVDVTYLKDLLTDINPKANMLGYVTTILTKNNFVVMNLPSYVNFYNVQDAVKNPIPKAEGTTVLANTLFGNHMNVDYRESSAKLVCFYAGKPSEQLDLKNNVDYRYRNDAFDLRRASDNPLLENQIGKKDWGLSNKVVGFNVDIGPQNQSIFHGFNVTQNAGQATSESLEVLNQMANLSNNRGGATQSVSLYNLYKNRSYTCSLSMLGNALIQPTMYFNLRNVPMFSGPYMITEVNHSISPGNFTTTAIGIRQPTASLPKIENYIQSLRTNLLQSIITKANSVKVSKDNTPTNNSNVINETTNINNTVTQQPANTLALSDSNVCQPAKQYVSYKKGDNPNQTSLSYKSVVSSIKSSTNDVRLQLLIFSIMYVQTGSKDGLNTYENNYAGITLNEEPGWGQVSQNFFGSQSENPPYYCSSNNVPYAYFENIDKNIEFLIARWGLRLGELSDNSAKSITKFLILYSTPNKKAPNVYDNYPKIELGNYESKVQDAIDKFNAII